MKTGIFKSSLAGKNKISRLEKWSDHHEGGKRKGRCAGNGSVKGSEKKNTREKWEEWEVHNSCSNKVGVYKALNQIIFKEDICN